MDLLASLAGKLLEECESSSASSNAFEVNNHESFGKEIKQEDHLKSESSDQGNSVSRPTYEKTCVVNSFLFPDDGILERTPVCETKNVKSEGVTEERGDVIVNTGFEQDGGLGADACNLEDATALGVQFQKSVCMDGDVKSPSCLNKTSNGSLDRQGNHTKLGRDDDEKLYSYHKFSSKFKSYRSPKIRRIRKSLSSKYWKQMAKEFGHYRAGKVFTTWFT